MAQQNSAVVQSIRAPAGGRRRAELSVPSPFRLLFVSILAMTLLALTVVGAVAYAVHSIDRLAVEAETDRARIALALVQAEGALPDVATASRLAHDFGLNDANFTSSPGRVADQESIVVPGSDAMLSWKPRRLGTEIFYQLAPMRLLACALFLACIGAVMTRLYRLTRDLEAQRRAAQELASRDALTGLSNRLGFDQQLVTSAELPALLYLDLDGFKQVNDSFGHGAGDDLLRNVARRLESLARPGDFVARIGGDEFAILRSAPTSRGELAELAADIGVALSEPMRLGGSQIQVGASIGIAMGSDFAGDSSLLVSAADGALYRAKALPGHAFVFADHRPEARAA